MSTYNAMDIANYIVGRSIDTKKPVSNLFLLKILYYVQAYFLVTRHDPKCPLFIDDIQKWGYGPVVPNVYSYFKIFGASEISYQMPYLVRVDDKLKFIDPSTIEIDQNDKVNIDLVFDRLYGKFGNAPFKLVDKTHEEPMWKNFKYEIEYEHIKNLVYSNTEIYDYFSDGSHWPWNQL